MLGDEIVHKDQVSPTKPLPDRRHLHAGKQNPINDAQKIGVFFKFFFFKFCYIVFFFPFFNGIDTLSCTFGPVFEVSDT